MARTHAIDALISRKFIRKRFDFCDALVLLNLLWRSHHIGYKAAAHRISLMLNRNHLSITSHEHRTQSAVGVDELFSFGPYSQADTDDADR